MHAPLVRAAREYGFWNEADYVAGMEEAEAVKRKQAAAAEAVAKRTPASWVVGGSRSKKAKLPPAPAPAPAAPVPAPAPARKTEATRFGVEPTADEVNTCAWMGLTPEAIVFSDTLNELGPRGTLSNEGRILRWCEVLTSDARHDAWTLNPDDYFNPDVYLPAARQAHLDWSKSLNRQAVEAAEAR